MKNLRYRVFKSKTLSMPVFSTNWKFLAEAWRAKCSFQSGRCSDLLPEGVIAFLLWVGEADLGLPIPASDHFERAKFRSSPHSIVSTAQVIDDQIMGIA